MDASSSAFSTSFSRKTSMPFELNCLLRIWLVQHTGIDVYRTFYMEAVLRKVLDFNLFSAAHADSFLHLRRRLEETLYFKHMVIFFILFSYKKFLCACRMEPMVIKYLAKRRECLKTETEYAAFAWFAFNISLPYLSF